MGLNRQSPEKYQIEAIIGKRIENGRVSYRVRWKSYGPEDDTWEPATELRKTCSGLIEKFNRQRPQVPLQSVNYANNSNNSLSTSLTSTTATSTTTTASTTVPMVSSTTMAITATTTTTSTTTTNTSTANAASVNNHQNTNQSKNGQVSSPTMRKSIVVKVRHDGACISTVQNIHQPLMETTSPSPVKSPSQIDIPSTSTQSADDDCTTSTTTTAAAAPTLLGAAAKSSVKAASSIKSNSSSSTKCLTAIASKSSTNPNATSNNNNNNDNDNKDNSSIIEETDQQLWKGLVSFILRGIVFVREQKRRVDRINITGHLCKTYHVDRRLTLMAVEILIKMGVFAEVTFRECSSLRINFNADRYLTRTPPMHIVNYIKQADNNLKAILLKESENPYSVREQPPDAITSTKKRPFSSLELVNCSSNNDNLCSSSTTTTTCTAASTPTTSAAAATVTPTSGATIVGNGLPNRKIRIRKYSADCKTSKGIDVKRLSSVDEYRNLLNTGAQITVTHSPVKKLNLEDVIKLQTTSSTLPALSPSSLTTTPLRFVRMTRSEDNGLVTLTLLESNFHATMFEELERIFIELNNDDSCHLIVIQSHDFVFSYGVNYNELYCGGGGGGVRGETTESDCLSTTSSIDSLSPSARLATFMTNCLLAMLNFTKPIIAGVRGPVVGVAVGMLLLCDLVYASEMATFLLPYTDLGQIPEAGLCVTLPPVIGLPLANEMILCGRLLTAKLALQRGLLSDIFPQEEFQQELDKRCELLAAKPSKSIQVTKCMQRLQNKDHIETAIIAEKARLIDIWDCPVFRTHATKVLDQLIGLR